MTGLVHQLVDRRGAGRIGLGRLHAAVGGATAPGHNGCRILGDGLQDRLGGLAADHAVNAVVLGGHRAFHQHNVLALVVLDGVAEALLRLEAGGGHQGFGVVETEHVQQRVHHDGVRCADERLAAAGALLEVHPNHGRLFLLLEGRDNLGDAGLAEAGHCCGRGAELQKISAAVALLLH